MPRGKTMIFNILRADNRRNLFVFDTVIGPFRYNIIGRWLLPGIWPLVGKFVPMRNTTKLKQVLSRYDLTISMDTGFYFQVIAIDKSNKESGVFEGKSYSDVLNKVHQYYNKEIKKSA
jgi:hypothetical protein